MSFRQVAHSSVFTKIDHQNCYIIHSQVQVIIQDSQTLRGKRKKKEKNSPTPPPPHSLNCDATVGSRVPTWNGKQKTIELQEKKRRAGKVYISPAWGRKECRCLMGDDDDVNSSTTMLKREVEWVDFLGPSSPWIISREFFFQSSSWSWIFSPSRRFGPSSSS